MLALLAEDLADLPTDVLAKAIQRHCVASPYMPKAADLVRLAQDMPGAGTAKRPVIRTARPYAEDLAEAANRAMSQADVDRGLEWTVGPHGDLKFGISPAWTAEHTDRLKRHHEEERQRWLANHRDRLAADHTERQEGWADAG